jgi:hypothetical protein
MRNEARANDSRRQVQRRFPPGAFGVDNWTCLLFTVVGWMPSTATVWVTDSSRPSRLGPTKARKAEKVASHDAILLKEGVLVNVNWEQMATQWTLTEWVEAFADAE